LLNSEQFSVQSNQQNVHY